MDAAEATVNAVYDALSGSGGVTQAAVYSHAPEDAAFPMVIVADISGMQPLVAGGDPDCRLTLTILTLTEAEEKFSCLARQAEINAALNGKILSVTGWQIAPSLDAQSTVLDEEGLGYVGTNEFSVIALTA